MTDEAKPDLTDLFEKIISREIPSNIVYEDNIIIAILDISPFEKGHTLVIPKKRARTVFDMSDREYLELQRVVLKIAKNMNLKLNCGVSIWQHNNSEEHVPWVHFHVVPRLLKGKIIDRIENRWKYDSEDEKKEFEIKLKL